MFLHLTALLYSSHTEKHKCDECTTPDVVYLSSAVTATVTVEIDIRLYTLRAQSTALCTPYSAPLITPEKPEVAQ